jgi:hypothetical protein
MAQLPADLDRAALLALTPDKYLAAGYCDPAGKPRPELRSTYATAASTQLEQTETSPQELAATFEALKQVLPLHQGTPHERATGAADEALLTASSLLDKENNPGIVAWLAAAADAVRSDADLDAFVDHVQAVVRQYAVIAALANG